MKRITKTIYGILSLSLFLVGCNLDEYPSSQIASGQSFETVADAVKFNRGAYSYFRSAHAGVHVYATDLQTDVLNATKGFGNNGGDLYRWDFTSGQYDVKSLWDTNYSLINNANFTLANIDAVSAKTIDPKEKATLDGLKGEAYLFRAIAYHNLVLRFAKDYEPATAATDPGLPIVTIPNGLEFKPSRSSVADTYAFIKKDIAEARKLMTTEGKHDSDYFTVDVIDAFEARVNLYMHDFAGAFSLAIKNVDDYKLITNVDEYKKMWKDDVSTEVLFQAYRSVDERSSQLGIYLYFSEGAKKFRPYYVPTKTILEQYSETDIRRIGGFITTAINTSDVDQDDVVLINKYPGNDKLTTTAYTYYNKTKVFRIAEQYLIAAEAAYMDGKQADALTWLNKLRKARQVSETAATGEELLKVIQNEWAIEFLAEGKRLDDLKRWHMGFDRGTSQYANIVIEGGSDLKIEKDNVKFVWEIPDQDRAANPNIVRNW